MITIVYAGILGILYVGLSLYVIAGRYRYKTSLGDGGVPDLEKRIRVHGNFAEYVPFALLLLFMTDYVSYSPIIIHVLGIMLVIGRVLHIPGILRGNGANFLRAGGVILTQLVILTCSILLIYHFLVLRVVAA